VNTFSQGNGFGLGPLLVHEADAVSIRGVELPLPELVDHSLFNEARQAELQEQLHQALPFPHLVLERVFDARLLELLSEEFDVLSDRRLNSALENSD
jgi:hypothetical protein